MKREHTPERPHLLIDKRLMSSMGVLPTVLHAVIYDLHNTDIGHGTNDKWIEFKEQEVLEQMGITKEELNIAWETLVGWGEILPERRNGIVYFKI